MNTLPDWYLQLRNAMDERVGLEVLEISPDRTVGRMPVEGNTQPMGFWHGGATCVLAESLGSLAATAHGIERLAAARAPQERTLVDALEDWPVEEIHSLTRLLHALTSGVVPD